MMRDHSIKNIWHPKWYHMHIKSYLEHRMHMSLCESHVFDYVNICEYAYVDMCVLVMFVMKCVLCRIDLMLRCAYLLYLIMWNWGLMWLIEREYLYIYDDSILGNECVWLYDIWNPKMLYINSFISLCWLWILPSSGCLLAYITSWCRCACSGRLSRREYQRTAWGLLFLSFLLESW